MNDRPCLLPCTSDVDTMEIVSDEVTLPSIVRLMSNPTVSKEVMSGCLKTLSEMSNTIGAIDVIAKTDALALALHYIDDNVFELPREVRPISLACVPKGRFRHTSVPWALCVDCWGGVCSLGCVFLPGPRHGNEGVGGNEPV